MKVRRTDQTSLLWGRRQRRSERAPHPRRASAASPATAVSFTSPSQRRRQGGASQDRALYTCGCGHVFAELVSTSVDCPECGDTQAW